MLFIKKLRNNRFSICIVLIVLFSKFSNAVEFNMNIIDALDRDNIDIRHFSNPNFIFPGEYLVDITLNGHKLMEQLLINFYQVDEEHSNLCITPKMIDFFGLKNDIKQKILQNNIASCIKLPKQLDIHYNFDKPNQNILFSIPQAWLEYNDPDWVSPSLWDNGVTGIFLDYNIFSNYSIDKNKNKLFNVNGYNTLGINLDNWRFRSDFQYQHHRSNFGMEQKFDWTQHYGFRVFPELGTKMVLGDTYLNTALFDSFRFVGISFFTDSRMLPPSMRGYSPQISGIAKTNANVVISQYGRVIKQLRVAPGPFHIQDITETVQGTLDVLIEEEDQTKKVYQVTATALPFLTRKGQLQYKLASGKLNRSGSFQYFSPWFISSELSYGMLSNTSLFGGLIAMTHNGYYQAANIGIGQNMEQFGALSFDMTRMQTELERDDLYLSHRYRLNYIKRFESTNSQITFTGEKYSNEKFFSLPQYINTIDGFKNFRQDKNRYSLSYNQYISILDANAYFNVSHNQFWHASDMVTFGISLSKLFHLDNSIKNISTTLSFNKIKYHELEDNQAAISFSIPLENLGSFSYELQYANDGKDINQSVAYYSENRNNRAWDLRLSGNKYALGHMEPSIGGNYQYSSPYGVLNMNATEDVNSYRTLGGSWYGSITATQYGIALHRSGGNNEPRVMIDSNNISDISLSNGLSKTNRFGIGVATQLNSFVNSEVYIDVNTLPDNVDVSETIIRKTLTEGAIGYKAIKAHQGLHLFAVIHLKNGLFPPLGSSVVDDKTKQEVGIISDKGNIYLTGVNSKEKYTINWGGINQCHFNIPHFFDQKQRNIISCI